MGTRRTQSVMGYQERVGSFIRGEGVVDSEGMGVGYFRMGNDFDRGVRDISCVIIF